MTIPLPILQFAVIDSPDGGIHPANPIAWHETADEWIIVYEDGRKMRHSTPLAPSKQIEASGAKSEAHQVPIDTICQANRPTAATPAKAAGEREADLRRNRIGTIRPVRMPHS